MMETSRGAQKRKSANDAPFAYAEIIKTCLDLPTVDDAHETADILFTKISENNQKMNGAKQSLEKAQKTVQNLERVYEDCQTKANLLQISYSAVAARLQQMKQAKNDDSTQPVPFCPVVQTVTESSQSLEAENALSLQQRFIDLSDRLDVQIKKQEALEERLLLDKNLPPIMPAAKRISGVCAACGKTNIRANAQACGGRCRARVKVFDRKIVRAAEHERTHKQ